MFERTVAAFVLAVWGSAVCAQDVLLLGSGTATCEQATDLRAALVSEGQADEFDKLIGQYAKGFWSGINVQRMMEKGSLKSKDLPGMNDAEITAAVSNRCVTNGKVPLWVHLWHMYHELNDAK